MIASRVRPTEAAKDQKAPLPDTFVEFAQLLLGVRLTRGQRVLAAVVFDGVDPAALGRDDRALAAKLFGEVDIIPQEARLVSYWLKGARMGGSYLWALFLLYSSLTCPLTFLEPGDDGSEDHCDGLAPGEIPFAVIVAPDLKLARQTMRYVTGAALSSPRLRPLIIGDPGTDSMTLLRDDGQRVTIECRAASRGGKTTRGFSYCGALLEESCFFFNAETGVVNDLEIHRSISSRLLPGAKMGVISTAFAERGLLWEAVQKHHKVQQRAVAVVAPTLLVRNTARNRKVVAEEYERDPLNAAREYDCVPYDTGASQFFDKAAIDACLCNLPEINFGDGRDPSVLSIDTAFRRDATGGTVIRLSGTEFVLAESARVTPEPGKKLKPSETISSLVERGKAHGAHVLLADQHYIETVREHAEDLELVEAPAGNAGKVAMYLAAKKVIDEGLVKIPAGNTGLARQLKDVVSKPLPGGGLQISSPRTKLGGHGDEASAFVLGLWYLATGNVGSDVGEEGYGAEASGRYADDEDDDDEDYY